MTKYRVNMDGFQVGSADLPYRELEPLSHALSLAQWVGDYCQKLNIKEVGHTWSVKEDASEHRPEPQDVTDEKAPSVPLSPELIRVDESEECDSRSDLYAYSQKLLQAHPYTQVLNRVWDELIAMRVQVGNLMGLISMITENRTAVPTLDQATTLLDNVHTYAENTLLAHAQNMENLHAALGRLTCEESYLLGLTLTPLGDPVRIWDPEADLIADAVADDADDAAEDDDADDAEDEVFTEPI